MTEVAYGGQELDAFAHATNWKKYFRHLLEPYLRGKVLEVGAGIGATTLALWHSGVDEWVCLEPDSSFVARLDVMKREGLLPPVVKVVAGLTQDLPAERSFDTILYIDVLEHIADDAAELRSAAQHLAPGGAIVVLSPAWPWLFSEFDRAIGHHRRYTRSSLRAAVPPELRIERLFFADVVGLAFSVGNRLLLRQSLPTEKQVKFWDRTAIPLSRVVDPLIARSIGRSIIGILRRA
jgi:SAM-dependent methyltransferase